MKVPVQFGCYHCGACGQGLKFEQTQMDDDITHAIGYCDNGHECYDKDHMKKNCKRWNVRLRIPVQTIEAEIVE